MYLSGMEIQNTGTTSNKVAEGAEAKKTQKVSVSYTLKSFKENINKLEILEMVTPKEAEKLREIHKLAVIKFVDNM